MYVGGGLHSFRKFGHNFDTGLHSVGKSTVEDCQNILGPLCPNFEALQTPSSAATELDCVYDSIRFQDNNIEINLSPSWSAWESAYTSKFPEDSDKIHQFRLKMENICRSYGKFFFVSRIALGFFENSTWIKKLLKTLVRCFTSCIYTKASSDSAKSVAQVLQDCRIDKDSILASALCGQFGNHLKPPSKTSFFLHACICNHYVQGGFYPKGGSPALVKGFVQKIQEDGRGRVFSHASFENASESTPRTFEVVCTKTGEKLFFKAKKIFLCTSIVNINSLKPFWPKKNAEPSETLLFLFAKLRDCRKTAGTVWIHPQTNTGMDEQDRLREQSMYGTDCPMSFYVSVRPESAVVMATAKWGWLENVRNIPRDTSVDQNLTENSWRIFQEDLMLQALLESQEIQINNVEQLDFATPETVSKFLNSQKGAVYGTDSSPERFVDPDLIRTSFFYNDCEFIVSGQDLVTSGISGAFAAAEASVEGFFIKIFLKKWYRMTINGCAVAFGLACAFKYV